MLEFLQPSLVVSAARRDVRIHVKLRDCFPSYTISDVVNAVDYAALVCLPGCRRRGIRVNGNAENENFPCSWS